MTPFALVLGATGQIGHDLMDRLAESGLDSVGVGRNPVRLELLTRSGHKVLPVDVADPAALRLLPEAEWLVDLTYARGRLPRTILRGADRQATLLRAYADAHPGSHVLQIGTFVVAGYQVPAPFAPMARLTWEDPYLLAKSAAEIALTRRNHDSRLRILRLGNVVAIDTHWATLIARTLLAGTGPESGLSSPANLCTTAEVVSALRSDSPLISSATAIAGFSWLEVIDAVLTQLGDAGGRFSPSPVGDTAGRRVTKWSRSEVLLRLLRLVPLRLEGARPWEWKGLGGLSRIVAPLRSDTVTAGLPPAVPRQSPMPGGGRDQTALKRLAVELALAYASRGYN